MAYRNLWVFALLTLNFLLLYYLSSTLSIGGYEAKMLQTNDKLSALLANTSLELLRNDDFALRLPFMILHILSALLIYLFSLRFLAKKEDALGALFLFIIIPGVNSSALLINEASIALFFTLLFLYLYETKRLYSLLLLPLLAILGGSFWPLFLALFAYGVYAKKGAELTLGALLFGLNMYIYGFDVSGIPKGYFLDSLGGFSAVLSPPLFLFFLYALYRILIKEQKPLIWFVVFVPFIIALLLSLRQKIDFEVFGSYLVISVPILVKVFMNGYRVRLPQFRLKYKTMLILTLVVLIATMLSAVFSKQLYILYDNPKKHFAYNYQVAKELAKKLKEMGVNGITSDDGELVLRLGFYGIREGDEYMVSQKSNKCEPLSCKKVSILYSGVQVATFYVTKLNTSN